MRDSLPKPNGDAKPADEGLGTSSVKRLPEPDDWQRVDFVMLPKRLTHRTLGLSASAFDIVAHLIAMTFKHYGDKRHALAMDAGKGHAPKKAARLYEKRARTITPEPAILEFRSGNALRKALHRPHRNLVAWEALRQEIKRLRSHEIVVGGVPITAITKLHIPKTGPIRITIHEDLLEQGKTLRLTLPLMKKRQSAARLHLFMLVANWTEPRAGEKRVYSITLRKLAQKIGLPEKWELWRIRWQVKRLVATFKGAAAKFSGDKVIFMRVPKPKV